MKAKIILYLEMFIDPGDYYDPKNSVNADTIRDIEARELDLYWHDWLVDHKKDLKLLGRVVDVIE